MLRLLLNHGARAFINAPNDVGDTALIVCARQCDTVTHTRTHARTHTARGALPSVTHFLIQH